MKKIKSALISVYKKEIIDSIINLLNNNNVTIFSTGGTYEYLKNKANNVIPIEKITGYPSIFGGRVKTLHPAIFGGILFQRDNTSDINEKLKYNIPEIDMVIVDLYPFEQTLKENNDESKIIEMIDIGGISLIRAAAKNFKDVFIIPSYSYLDEAIKILESKNMHTDIEDRIRFASYAFHISSEYDITIFNYFNNKYHKENPIAYKMSAYPSTKLRYGENPHQTAEFYGNLEEILTQLHGKEISYNNLLDIESAINLINEFDNPTIAIIKHTNPCGVATRDDIFNAWEAAYSSDPISAFGGIIIANRPIDEKTANKINDIFFEILIAPEFTQEALSLLKSKKNRILIRLKKCNLPIESARTLLNGILRQDKDLLNEKELSVVTDKKPAPKQIEDLLFANKVVKHTKSNAIVIVKNRQLIGIGTGQTSRIDALKHAIEKAKQFNFDLKDAVMASDAFFPFNDCVLLAHEAGISAIIQPGGSIRDKDSIDTCNEKGIAMIFSNTRHFKH